MLRTLTTTMNFLHKKTAKKRAIGKGRVKLCQSTIETNVAGKISELTISACSKFFNMNHFFSPNHCFHESE